MGDTLDRWGWAMPRIRGEEAPLDAVAGLERMGGALGARFRLWELLLLSRDWASRPALSVLSKPDEERA